MRLLNNTNAFMKIFFLHSGDKKNHVWWYVGVAIFWSLRLIFQHKSAFISISTNLRGFLFDVAVETASREQEAVGD
jgi:hypothetical protein